MDEPVVPPTAWQDRLAAELVERTPWIITAALVVACSTLLWLAWRYWARRRIVEVPEAQLPPINLAALGETGPRTTGAVLHLYHVPVRLALAVISPVGRARLDAPEIDREAFFAHLLEQLVPRLGDVVEADHPDFIVWPPQLSSRGFATALFARLALPGRHGKGSPWSAVSGRFEHGDVSLLVGLVLRAAGANNLGEFTLARETQWLEALAVFDLKPWDDRDDQ